jgi:hypothetical protein
MVDYDPWHGNYTNTIVRHNTIAGGFATDQPDSPTDQFGTNNEDVIIKFVPFLPNLSIASLNSLHLGLASPSVLVPGLETTMDPT